MKKLSIILLFFSSLFLYSNTFAGFTDYLGGAPGSVFTVQNLFNLASGLSCRFIQFGVIALGVMIVVYGLLFIKSRGNPTGMTDAKKALTWGVIGGLVIMGVFTIILTLGEIIGVTNYPILKIISCS